MDNNPLGNEYPTFALALPLLWKIKSILGNATLTEKSLSSVALEEFYHSTLWQLESCQRILLESFEKRFEVMDSSILWISCLDPRLRGMKHLSPREHEASREMTMEETLHLAMIEQIKKDAESPPVVVRLNDTEASSDADILNDIFDSPQRHRDIPREESPSESSDSRKRLLKAQIKLKFGNYLNEKHFVESNQDPLEWWRVNRTVYPKLALSARKWLSVCATSTASERVFSSCGVALSAKRSNLNGSTLKAQILLKNNLPCSELHLDDIVNAL